MHRDYKLSRVCTIDYYPLLIDSIKETLHICKKYNIPFITQGKKSGDVQKFFYHYCLDKFCTAYKECKSQFPKVLVVYPIPKNIPFSDKNLDKILSVLPLPWVRCNSFTSPDVEFAALGALNNYKGNTSKVTDFAQKHALRNFLNTAKKTKYFSTGTVDLSLDTN